MTAFCENLENQKISKHDISSTHICTHCKNVNISLWFLSLIHINFGKNYSYQNTYTDPNS